MRWPMSVDTASPGEGLVQTRAGRAGPRLPRHGGSSPRLAHTSSGHRAQLEEWPRTRPARGVVRRDRRTATRAARTRPDRRAPDERQPTPTAGCYCGTWTFRRFPITRSPWRSLASGTAEATRVLGTFLRDVIARNPDHSRIMGPDETASNRLNAVFEATNKVWMADTVPPMKATPPAAGLWKCSPSICVRAGSRVIY
jgi:xylulose-5-phosphate/fructose-6-phosphate phosphoketolase